MNFEASRKKILEELKRQKAHKKVLPAKSSYISRDPSGTLNKITIIIFAQKSLFLSNLLASMGRAYNIEVFYDVDKAIDFIIEHGVRYVITDIDPPSDYHNVANFLTVAKTVSVDIAIFVCTKDRVHMHAQVLAQHGGIIMDKPLSITELTSHITTREKKYG